MPKPVIVCIVALYTCSCGTVVFFFFHVDVHIMCRFETLAEHIWRIRQLSKQVSSNTHAITWSCIIVLCSPGPSLLEIIEVLHCLFKCIKINIAVDCYVHVCTHVCIHVYMHPYSQPSLTC